MIPKYIKPPPGYRPTMGLRCRNIWKWGKRVGIVEQLYVNDDQTNWQWIQVPLVKDGSPMSGEGPPPPFGDIDDPE